MKMNPRNTKTRFNHCRWRDGQRCYCHGMYYYIPQRCAGAWKCECYDISKWEADRRRAAMPERNREPLLSKMEIHEWRREHPEGDEANPAN